MNIRVGQGYDSHALVDDRPLYIGGAHLEHYKGALGHSDGDCLLHAIIDSLLGALGKGDIGLWFPDNDPSLKGIRSTELFRRVLNDPNLPKFKWINLDLTLFLNNPKMKPHRESIIHSISELIHLETDRINLKAKTWEGLSLDHLISASATCLIELEE